MAQTFTPVKTVSKTFPLGLHRVLKTFTLARGKSLRYSIGMSKPTRDSTKELLTACLRFMRETGMSAKRFGLESCGDEHLIRRLREGKSVLLTTADKIRAYIESQRRLKTKRPPNDGAAQAA